MMHATRRANEARARAKRQFTMVSASRSFGYVLRVVAGTAGAHSSSRRAHTLSASSAALLRQAAAGPRKLASAGTRCLSTETPSAAPRAQG